jgi:ubiquinol-cytochrome c reductase cytochrome b subunit
MAVLLVLVAGTLLAVLTYAGATAPWSPKMDAWSGDPVPADVVKRSSPLELQGAAVFQNKNCRNCHALEGSGGRRGPDLTDVGTRLSRDQLIDQIANGSPGGGYMPAYGKHVSPAEMEALAAFLGSLRPPGQAPARRADEPASRRAAAP